MNKNTKRFLKIAHKNYNKGNNPSTVTIGEKTCTYYIGNEKSPNYIPREKRQNTKW